jgi:hypothetical protein
MLPLDKLNKIEARRKTVSLFYGESMRWISENMKHNFMKTQVEWSTSKNARKINFGTIWKCNPLILHEAEISIIVFFIKNGSPYKWFSETSNAKLCHETKILLRCTSLGNSYFNVVYIQHTTYNTGNNRRTAVTMQRPVNTWQQYRGNCVLYAVCAKQTHGTIWRLLLGNGALHIHP